MSGRWSWPAAARRRHKFYWWGAVYRMPLGLLAASIMVRSYCSCMQQPPQAPLLVNSEGCLAAPLCTLGTEHAMLCLLRILAGRRSFESWRRAAATWGGATR